MILGVDFSTKAIHGALIPLEHGNGEPHIVFRTEQIPASKDPLARYADAGRAIRRLCADEPDRTGYADPLSFPVSLVVVEEPMGRYGVRPLNRMFGAIIASIPIIPTISLKPMEWRRELGLPARLTKPAAIDLAIKQVGWAVGDIDEHMAEALLIALAGRQQNNREWDAA